MALPGDPQPPRHDPQAPPEQLIPADWPRQATDTVVRTVDTVRDKTTGPIITIAGGVVYGLVALVAATVALVLGTIGALRLLNAGLEDRLGVWASYLVLGVVFTLAGFFCWSRRPPMPRPGELLD
ncbi:MAG: hypothetical protein JJU45_05220 [Acidimicrobiia bacterium]|nr:hypothetical protein [Acidimicrobiia bacterium]